ncbi:hypothetical protein HJA83_04625 [Rhizobium bangladeshense]|nr:hypothetical protein [Rhizobium bangladeshense]MBX4900647.1 hypothetical protein [Rhizobium bangladeshense]MBX4912854.1 hypothetical protein [Rhizobium bangladeshense]MBY3615203.1 dihydrofolate reductase family protein [Rhizobium bangladeshense]
MVSNTPCLVSLAVKQSPKAGTANVIPTNSDRLLSKIDIPDSAHPSPLPQCLGEIGEIEAASPELTDSLTELGLIDEYRIYLHPVLVGQGEP